MSEKVTKSNNSSPVYIEKLKDTKPVSRRTDNIMTKGKRTNHALQNKKQKTKDRATRNPLKTGDELRCSGRASSSCSTCDTLRVTVKRHEHHLIWKSC